MPKNKIAECSFYVTEFEDDTFLVSMGPPGHTVICASLSEIANVVGETLKEYQQISREQDQKALRVNEGRGPTPAFETQSIDSY